MNLRKKLFEKISYNKDFLFYLTKTVIISGIILSAVYYSSRKCETQICCNMLDYTERQNVKRAYRMPNDDIQLILKDGSRRIYEPNYSLMEKIHAER